MCEDPINFLTILNNSYFVIDIQVCQKFRSDYYSTVAHNCHGNNKKKHC